MDRTLSYWSWALSTPLKVTPATAFAGRPDQTRWLIGPGWTAKAAEAREEKNTAEAAVVEATTV